MKRTTALALASIAVAAFAVLRSLPDDVARESLERASSADDTAAHDAAACQAGSCPSSARAAAAHAAHAEHDATGADGEGYALWVVDARDGAPVTAALVVSPRSDVLGSLPAHPGAFGEGDVIARGAGDPLRLPEPDRHARAWWVGAPGYAWRALPRERSSSGGERVELQPAATLEVNVTGLPDAGAPSGDLHLELVTEDGGRLLHQRLEGPYVSVEGLPGATAEARLVARFMGRSEVLDRAPALLVEGALTTVRLVDHREPAPPDDASLRVIVQLPTEVWNDLDVRRLLQVQFDPDPDHRPHRLWNTLGRRVVMDRLGDRLVDGRFVWPLVQLRPGPYLMRVEPLGIERRVEVVRGTDGEVLLDVPPLAITLLSFEDETGMAQVRSEKPTVSRVPSSEGAPRRVLVRRSREYGLFEVLSAPGELVLHGSPPEVRTVELGWNEWRVPIEERSTLRVALARAEGATDDSTPWPLDWAEKLSLLDGASRDVVVASDQGVRFKGRGELEPWVELSVVRPGRYRLMADLPLEDGARERWVEVGPGAASEAVLLELARR